MEKNCRTSETKRFPVQFNYSSTLFYFRFSSVLAIKIGIIHKTWESHKIGLIRKGTKISHHLKRGLIFPS